MDGQKHAEPEVLITGIASQPVPKQPFYKHKYFPLGLLGVVILAMAAFIFLIPFNRSLTYPASLLTYSFHPPPTHPTAIPGGIIKPGNSAIARGDLQAKIPTPTQIPTPTVDPGISWLTYNNPTYDYSILYPPDWNEQSVTSADPMVPSFIVFNPNSATSSATTVTLTISDRSYQDQVAINGGTNAGNPITVASIHGTEQLLQDSDGNQTDSVILPLSNNIIIINGAGAYNSIFTTMLSTLRFTK